MLKVSDQKKVSFFQTFCLVFLNIKLSFLHHGGAFRQEMNKHGNNQFRCKSLKMSSPSRRLSCFLFLWFIFKKAFQFYMKYHKLLEWGLFLIIVSSDKEFILKSHW